MQKVLFVCLGNICRSPTAEGVFREVVKAAGRESDFEIDSAGTGSWHVGEAPDRRAQHACLRAGSDISAHRARRVSMSDFSSFDLILACDRQNYADLLKLAPTEARGKVHLLMHFAPDAAVDEVPDPYYGNDAGFDRTVELCRTACNGVLKALS